jgi:hypothetical protein
MTDCFANKSEENQAADSALHCASPLKIPAHDLSEPCPNTTPFPRSKTSASCASWSSPSKTIFATWTMLFRRLYNITSPSERDP